MHKDSRTCPPVSHSRFHPSGSLASSTLGLTRPTCCPNKSNVLSAIPNHSNHSFPLFGCRRRRSICIIGNERKTSILPRNQLLLLPSASSSMSDHVDRPFLPLLFRRGRLSVVRLPPSIRPSSAGPGSLLYLESDLFSQSPSPSQPPTPLSRMRRRRPTSNLSNYYRDRDERRTDGPPRPQHVSCAADGLTGCLFLQDARLAARARMSENSEGASASAATAATAAAVVVDLMYRAPRRLFIETAKYSDCVPLDVHHPTSVRSQSRAGHKRRPSVRPRPSVSPANRLSPASSGGATAQECTGGREGKGWLAEGRKKEGRKEGRKEGVFLLT